MKLNNSKLNLPTLTSTQKEVLIGSLLGDGMLALSERSISPYFKVMRKLDDIKYLEWQFNHFSSFSSNIKKSNYLDKRTNKTYYGCYFLTRSHPELLPIYNNWYVDGIKLVPEDIIMSPLIAAIWFADDGHIEHFGKNELRLSLATDGFSRSDVLFLSSLLEKTLNEKFPFYLKGKSKDGKNQYIINGTSSATYAFIKYIEPYFNSLHIDRKNTWKNVDLSFPAQLKRSNKYYQFADQVLKLDTFYVRDILPYKIWKSKKQISGVLLHFLKLDFLIREKDIKHNAYCYKLTTLGKKYFSSLQNK